MDEWQWQRVQSWRPGLRAEVAFTPVRFRGRRGYVLSNSLTGQYLRLDARAYAVAGRLDGRRSIATILQQIDAEEGSDAAVDADATAADVMALLTRLQHAGCLDGDVARSAERLLSIEQNHRQRRRSQRLFSPLAIRLPLFDPDRSLEWLYRHSAHRPHRRLVLAATMFVVAILLLAVSHRADILRELNSTLVKPQSLLLMGCLYPLLKTLHEYAHALVVKHHGGAVHEMGVTLLVFFPVPYVDASASWSSRSVSERLQVSIAGMFAEMVVAALAFCLWLATAPGILHDAALGVFLIGSVSTVLFNANPLLRFDAYHVLADWLEIPNLADRSTAFYRYLGRRYVFAVTSADSPADAADEVPWLLAYGVLSSIYRVFVTLLIAWFLAEHYGTAGALLGLWALAMVLGRPLWRLAHYLCCSPELASRRPLAVTTLAGLILIGMAVLLGWPLPSHTTAQGIVSMPVQGQLYTPTGGKVSALHVQPGTPVTRGTPLVTLDNPTLQRDLAVARSRLSELEVLSTAPGDPGSGARWRRERTLLKAEVEDLQHRIDTLTIRAGMDGVFSSDHQGALAGRFFAAGDEIGLVVDPDRRVVRVVVPESSTALRVQGIRQASVRLADAVHTVHTATVLRETPQVDKRLPSAALGAAGGGHIPVRRDDPDGVVTDQPLVHLELGLPPGMATRGVGQRAYVNLAHPPESLGRRWLRTLRQTVFAHLPL